MSSLNRRSMVLAPLALAACGFQPIYAPGGTGTKLQNNMLATAPSDRYNFLLVRRIEERMGRSATPEYLLSLTLNIRSEGLEISAAGNTNRIHLIGVAGYALEQASTGAVLTSGTVNSFTGFSTTDSTVATLSSQEDAFNRLIVILGDLVVTRLLAAELPA